MLFLLRWALPRPGGPECLGFNVRLEASRRMDRSGDSEPMVHRSPPSLLYVYGDGAQHARRRRRDFRCLPHAAHGVQRTPPENTNAPTGHPCGLRGRETNFLKRDPGRIGISPRAGRLGYGNPLYKGQGPFRMARSMEEWGRFARETHAPAGHDRGQRGGETIVLKPDPGHIHSPHGADIYHGTKWQDSA